uniref:Putative product n=1 Tax=Xenopsylla cheopis TaxID=163159 RepID=A0A6M2DJM9_XENCH
MDPATVASSSSEGELGKNFEDIKEKLNNHLKRRMQENIQHRKSVDSATTSKVKRSKKMHRSASVDNQELEESIIETNDGPQDNKREPDILSEILNEKKLSLMQDPTVLSFLQKLCMQR